MDYKSINNNVWYGLSILGTKETENIRVYFQLGTLVHTVLEFSFTLSSIFDLKITS